MSIVRSSPWSSSSSSPRSALAEWPYGRDVAPRKRSIAWNSHAVFSAALSRWFTFRSGVATISSDGMQTSRGTREVSSSSSRSHTIDLRNGRQRFSCCRYCSRLGPYLLRMPSCREHVRFDTPPVTVGE